jgi:hypothetical protein
MAAIRKLLGKPPEAPAAVPGSVYEHEPCHRASIHHPKPADIAQGERRIGLLAAPVSALDPGRVALGNEGDEQALRSGQSLAFDDALEQALVFQLRDHSPRGGFPASSEVRCGRNAVRSSTDRVARHLRVRP